MRYQYFVLPGEQNQAKAKHKQQFLIKIINIQNFQTIRIKLLYFPQTVGPSVALLTSVSAGTIQINHNHLVLQYFVLLMLQILLNHRKWL